MRIYSKIGDFSSKSVILFYNINEMSIPKKNILGQFNTISSVWLKPHIKKFILSSKRSIGLDPFAGRGDLIKVMEDLDLKKVVGYDVDDSLGWVVNDSLKNIPFHEDAIVVTNPPYFAKVSMSRSYSKDIEYFEGNQYSDLYQLAIEKVLEKYDKAVFIIPETYFQSHFFKDSVRSITILEENPFIDTDCPVCVACFDTDNENFMLNNRIFDIYKGEKFLFDSDELEYRVEKVLGPTSNRKLLYIRFNDKQGNVGLRGVDGTDKSDRIRFCTPAELNYDFDNIKDSSRAISILNVSCRKFKTINEPALIEKANHILEKLRSETSDVIFSPFKNNNKEGTRRRRLDFYFAKRILNKARSELQ